MERLPKAVENTFQRLKREYSEDLRIAYIKGVYYVQEPLHLIDKDLNKKIYRTKYLGKITDDGFFVPTRKRVIRRAKAMNSIEYEELYDKFMAEKSSDKEQTVNQVQKFTKGEEFMLRALGMNCRIPTPYVSKFLGMSAYGLRHDIKSLENRLGIKYTLELDVEKLGFMYYIIGVRFRDKKPSFQEIREAADRVDNVQLAMVCSGDYDLLMYVIVENNTTVARNMFYEIRENMFPEYDSSWYVMLFYKTYGYVPLHTDFFKMLERKVWKRTKEIPKKPNSMIWQREYNVLKDMCDDSRQSLTDIDARRAMNMGSARYTYQSLLDRAIIIRPTIAMRMLPIKYNAAIFVEKTNHLSWEKDRINILRDIVHDTDSIDRYALVGDIKSPEGVFYIMPVMNDSDVDDAKEELRNAVKGIGVASSIITGIAKGMLGYRVFDNDYSNQRKILVEYYKEKMPNKMDYKLQSIYKNEKRE
ncbi:transcriptional regulator, AsnC family [mine drainage metagenome]|uniref:Transcriptional regulator, AsnC family n=1 Tax=mine drainage metagenome TaxID=410659 RepID=T0ZH87_9ZZZZ